MRERKVSAMKVLWLAVMFLTGTSIIAIESSAEEIKIEGGAAAITVVFSPIKEAYEKTTGDTLTITLSNPTNALISLEKGNVDMAALNSFILDYGIKQAKNQGVTIDPSKLQSTEVAQSKLVVFLHAGNKVRKLSKDQLKGIFTGKVNNWQEVGGDDQKISVIWGKETPILNSLFSKEILAGEQVTPKALPAGDHFNVREIVLATPGAIAINTNGLIMPNLKVPEVPTMLLPIISVTKGPPSAKVMRLLKFYREEFGYMNE